MGNRLRLKKGLLLLSFMIFICSLFSLGVFAGNKIFADKNIPTIRVGGESDDNLTIFRAGDHLWYPGKEHQETLRIHNQQESKVTINKLGMNINLVKDESEIDSTVGSGKYYMDNMIIEVDYKNPIKGLLNGSIFNEDYEEDLNFKNNFTEFVKGADCSIELSPNDYVDLVYTIKMNEEADTTIAGISGKVDFTVTVEGDGVSSGGGGSTGGSGGVGSGTTETEEEIIEEPVIVYPSLNGHWAHDCIIALLENEIIEGYEDGTIKPDNNITRAEAAVLVGKALDLKEKDKFFSGYIDAIPKWAKGYVIATTEEGVFKGYPMKLFKPGRNITREEMVAVLVRAFELKLEEDKELEFKDKDKISEWAEEYVKISVENKLIVGYEDNTFKANQNITRAEAFTIICKLLGYHEAHQDK